LASGALLAGGVIARGSAGPAAAPRLEAGTEAVPASAGGMSAVAPFRSPMLNEEGLFVLGAAGTGTAEVGEVLTTFDAINRRTGNPAKLARADFDAYVDEFEAAGRRMAALALSSRQAGHLVTARDRHLRAGSYLTQALFFVLGTSRPAREEQFFDWPS
jgi:hypothetical protein